MRLALMAVGWTCGALACGAPQAPRTAAEGTTVLSGPAAGLETAIYAIGTQPDGAPVLLIWMSSEPKICSLLAASSQAAESRVLAINMVQVDAFGNRIVPQPGTDAQVVGSFAQENGLGSYAGVELFSFDAACSQTLEQRESLALSGDVAVLRWNGQGAPLFGGIHAELGARQDLIDGQFVAQHCPALAITAQQAPTACSAN